MKKIIIIFAFAFVLSGCALVDAYKACQADPTGACMERAEGRQENAEAIATTAVSLVPHPIAQTSAPIAGKVVGYIVLFSSAVVGGYGLLKKEKAKVDASGQALSGQ